MAKGEELLGPLVLDFETRSEADLKKLGAHKYAEDPSTEVLCLGWKLGDTPARVWAMGRPFPEDLKWILQNQKITIVAHNAGFERAILNFVLSRTVAGLPIFARSRFRCTAAKSAAYGLPRSLEDAGAALNLPIQKDMVGNRLVKKYMKPAPKWKAWNLKGRIGLEPKKYYDDPSELRRLYEYCRTDVETEYLLDKVVPDLIPSEREAWLLNQRINSRGVRVDVEAAKKVLDIISDITADLTSELQTLTAWKVTSVSERDRFLKWIRGQGLKIDNLQARTVEDTLSLWE